MKSRSQHMVTFYPQLHEGYFCWVFLAHCLFLLKLSAVHPSPVWDTKALSFEGKDSHLLYNHLAVSMLLAFHPASMPVLISSHFLSSCSINAFYFLNESVSALHTPSSTATSLCKWFLSTVVLMANSLCRNAGQIPGRGYWYSKKKKDHEQGCDEYSLCIHSYSFYSCPYFSTLSFPTPTCWILAKFRPLSCQLIQSLLALVPTHKALGNLVRLHLSKGFHPPGWGHRSAGKGDPLLCALRVNRAVGPTACSLPAFPPH